MSFLTTAIERILFLIIISERTFTRHRGLLGVFRAFMLGLRRYKNADYQTVKEYLLIESNSPAEALRWDDVFIHKCRFFTKCLVIGSERFVREKLSQFSDKMKWKRSHKPYTEDEWHDIYSLKRKRMNSSWAGSPRGLNGSKSEYTQNPTIRS